MLHRPLPVSDFSSRISYSHLMASRCGFGSESQEQQDSTLPPILSSTRKRSNSELPDALRPYLQEEPGSTLPSPTLSSPFASFLSSRPSSGASFTPPTSASTSSSGYLKGEKEKKKPARASYRSRSSAASSALPSSQALSSSMPSSGQALLDAAAALCGSSSSSFLPYTASSSFSSFASLPASRLPALPSFAEEPTSFDSLLGACVSPFFRHCFLPNLTPLAGRL
jgi:hypothetical protein